MRLFPPLFVLLLALTIFVVNCSEDNPAEVVVDGLPPCPLPGDNELATEPDSLAVPVDSIHVAWMLANHETVRSLTSEEFCDLEFLAPILEGKTLVQLGESGHGVGEFDQAKVRLIKYLHEELGFDVIAFESSVYECFKAGREAGTLSAANVMFNSIFGVWHAEETLELFEYIKRTQATDRPLTLAGFDIQISSYSGVEGRHRFLGDVVARLDPGRAQMTAILDSTFVLMFRQGSTQFESFINSAGDTYRAFYEDLVDFFDASADTLRSLYTDDPLIPLVARQTAWSMIHFIDEYKYLHDYNALIYIRDSAMAENVDFLVDQAYPGEKIIIWAHNFHIRHKNEETYHPYDYNKETMGAWVAERHRPYLYTVGLYMYRGSAATNSREIYDVYPTLQGSLEGIMYRARKKYVFVDMLGESDEPGNSWMFDAISAKSWGVSGVRMVPRDQYDAILFIDTVHPPHYVTRTVLEMAGPDWWFHDR